MGVDVWLISLNNCKLAIFEGNNVVLIKLNCFYYENTIVHVGKVNILGWPLDTIRQMVFTIQCPIPLPSKMAKKAMEF